MDFSTRLYRSYMRPFRDRPDIKILGRWYACPPGASALPFSHVFGSQYGDTYREEFVEFIVGEQVGWHGPNKHQANPRYLGKHWCGTLQDWQEGALYGQAVPRDWEGVPLCCITTPLRPGGGVVGGKAPAFTPTQAIWWLNPDTLSDIPFGTEVHTWSTSAGPPNDALMQGLPTFYSGGPGIGLYQNPPHGGRNAVQATNPFTLSQCSWYFVGGGTGSPLTINGPNILSGLLPGSSCFVDNYTVVAVSTNHHIAHHAWIARAVFGLFSCAFDQRGLYLSLNGGLLAGSSVGSTDRMRIEGFRIGNNPIAPFEGAGTGFGEYILFGGVLSSEDDFTVLSYLARKYEIALGPDPIYFPASYFPRSYYARFFWPWTKVPDATNFFAPGFFAPGFFAAGFFP